MTAPTLHSPCSPVMIEVPIRRCTHSPCALLAMSMRASTSPTHKNTAARVSQLEAHPTPARKADIASEAPTITRFDDQRVTATPAKSPDSRAPSGHAATAAPKAALSRPRSATISG
jgi:hypothetical protein